MFELDSPEGPVRITRDGNGYPSIVARNPYAAAWAKGWLHAQDRLGQVLLTRMAAEGRLMELLGAQPLARTVDRAVHLLRLPVGLDDQVADLDERASRTLRTYCDGFEAGRQKRPMSRVLGWTAVETRPYTPADVLLSFRMLCFFGLTSFQQIAEMLVGEIAQHGGDTALIELLLGPAAAHGIDLDAIRGMSLPADLSLLKAPLGGSNAIAVSGKRSATGGALLIADPHLEIGRFPPVLYIFHEDYADGSYLQGLGVPGIPWLMMGRTRDVGISYTYGHADNIDVLIERCENGRCLRPDGWQTMRRRTERVKIRGAEDELWTYWDNDFGTIASEAADADLPCVRWAGLHESTARDVNAILNHPTCRTVDELIAGHRQMQMISLGAVIADRHGDIGWVHTGRVDARGGDWTGAYPQPGWTFDGQLEPLPESARPVLTHPPDGVIAAANESVDGMNGERWVNFAEPPYRLNRLRERMAACEAPVLRDLVAACLDEHDGMAERLAPIWSPLLAQRKFDDVAKWAASQPMPPDAKSRASLGLFHALHHEVVRALLERKLTSASAARILDELGGMLCFQAQLDDALALERPDALSRKDLQALLGIAWPRALALVDNGWAIPVTTRFKSIFTAGKLPAVLGFDSEVIEFPGGPTSPFQSRIMPFEGEAVVGGPAGRFCCDMSDDGGWYHVPGGASELPWGPGYGTGLREWKNGKFTALGRPTQAAPNLGDR